jgi:hypothetical protein
MRTRPPREYLILRVTRIHADRRELWRLRLKSLLVHRVVAAEAARAAPFHDGSVFSKRRSVILKE